MRALTTALLTLMLILSNAINVYGQSSEATIKDAGTAREQALRCPGCGHLYTGETTKGIILATVGLGSLLGGSVIALSRGPQVDCSGFTCDTSDSYTPLFVGAGISLVTYIYSLIDAGPSAERMNVRNGITISGLRVEPSAGAAVTGGTQVGVSVRLHR